MEPNYVLPTESHFKHNDIGKLKLKEWVEHPTVNSFGQMVVL